MEQIKDLMKHQNELKQEEGLILSLLTSIGKQLDALQVERLQLLSTANRVSRNPTPTIIDHSDGPSFEPQLVVKQELDLNVPSLWQQTEEIDEDESD